MADYTLAIGIAIQECRVVYLLERLVRGMPSQRLGQVFWWVDSGKGRPARKSMPV
jgi:hypothetical protein